MKKIISGIILLVATLSTVSAQYTFYKLKDLKAVDKYGRGIENGKKVWVEGICQSNNLSGKQQQYLFSINDTSAFMMIGVGQQNPRNRFIPDSGDYVRIYGTVMQYTNVYGGGPTGQQRDSTGMVIIEPDSVKHLGQANPSEQPIKVLKLMEEDEAKIVSIDSLKLFNKTDWKQNTDGRTSGFGFGVVTAYRANNPNDTIILRVFNQIISLLPAPGGLFSVRGIVSQWDTRSPFNQTYQLILRDTNDVIYIDKVIIPISKIKDIKRTNPTNGLEDSAGIIRIIKGVVQSPHLNRSNGLFFSVYDNTGAIVVSSTGNFGYTPQLGDSVYIKGTVQQLTIMAPPMGMLTTGWSVFIPTDFKRLNSFNPNKAVTDVAALEERYESDLVRLSGFRLTNDAQWDTTTLDPKNPKTSFTVGLTNDKGQNAVAVIYKTDSSLWWKPKPSGYYFNLTGIEGQNDNQFPLTANYIILPRDYHDLEIIPGSLPEKLISEIKINNADGSISTAGTKCYLRGIVYSPNLGTNGQLLFSLQDKSGAIIGFNQTNTMAYKPVMGDSVRVLGTVGQANGLAIFNLDSVKVLNSSNKMLAANTISYLAEQDEAYHRKINGLKLKNPAQWDSTLNPTLGGFAVTIQDTVTNDTFTAWINKATDLFKMPVPTDKFNLTGIVFQLDIIAPYNSGYYISPRGSFDLELLTGNGLEEQNLLNQFSIFPNPTTTDWKVTCSASNASLYSYTLTDISGKVIIREERINLSNTLTINAQTLSKGAYILKLSNGVQTYSYKVFKAE